MCPLKTFQLFFTIRVSEEKLEVLDSTYGARVFGNKRVISAMRSVFSMNLTAAFKKSSLLAKPSQRLLL